MNQKKSSEAKHDSSRMDQTVQYLLKDKQFSKRTAAAVLSRAETMPHGVTTASPRSWASSPGSPGLPANRARTWLAVAAAALLGISILFWNRQSAGNERYAGMTEASASALASVEQTDRVWEDTDSIINGALAAR